MLWFLNLYAHFLFFSFSAVRYLPNLLLGISFLNKLDLSVLRQRWISFHWVLLKPITYLTQDLKILAHLIFHGGSPCLRSRNIYIDHVVLIVQRNSFVLLMFLRSRDCLYVPAALRWYEMKPLVQFFYVAGIFPRFIPPELVQCKFLSATL